MPQEDGAGDEEGCQREEVDGGTGRGVRGIGFSLGKSLSLVSSPLLVNNRTRRARIREATKRAEDGIDRGLVGLRSPGYRFSRYCCQAKLGGTTRIPYKTN